jgi:hypothetical protein
MLGLTATNGAVAIQAKVLDLEAGGVVLFDQTFNDTSAADALAGSTDNPAIPYTGRGRFVLMADAELESGGPDPREVDFANAVVSPPAQAHLLAVIHGISLYEGHTSWEMSLANHASFIDPTFSSLFFLAMTYHSPDLDTDLAVVLGEGVGGHNAGHDDTTGPNTMWAGGGLELSANSQYSFSLIALTVSSLEPVLESAAAVTGPFEAKPGARVDVAEATIRLDVEGGAARFYRLRAQAPLRITSVQLSAPGLLTITYGPAANLPCTNWRSLGKLIVVPQQSCNEVAVHD